MAYVGPIWKNDPDHSSPINAANLEIMDEGITTNDRNCTTLEGAIDMATDSTVYKLIPGYRIANWSTSVNYTPVASEDFANGGYVIVDCNPGDTFMIRGAGVNASRLWSFQNSSGTILSKATATASETNLIIKAPDNAVKLVVNSTIPGLCIKGINIPSEIDTLNDEMEYAIKGVPTEVLSYGNIMEWLGHAVTFTTLFTPFTVKKKILFTGLQFITTISSACTLTIELTNSDESKVLNSITKSVSSGKQQIDANMACVLELGEYRLRFTVSTGSFYYPITSVGQGEMSDDYMDNTGTAYQHNNSRIKFIGNLIYSNGEKTVQQTNIDDIVFENPDVSDHNFTQNGGWTIENGVLVNNFSGSGNKWFEFGVDKTKLIDNMFYVEGDAVITSGNGFVGFLFGTKTNGTNAIYTIGRVNSNKHFKFDVDISTYVMYSDLDEAQPIRCGFSNDGSPNSGTISNYQMRSKKYELDESKEFYQNINDIASGVEENRNEISVLKSNQYLISPNGNVFRLAVSNEGVLSAVPNIPNKALFVGNSLLLGNGLFGMCASDINKDYYHFVTEAILAKNPDATFDKVKGVSFEQCTSVSAAETWMHDVLLPNLTQDIGLVLIQLGDNVATQAMINTFAETAEMLIQYIKEHTLGAKIAWGAGWYTAGRRQQIIAAACQKKGITFIDFSSAKPLGGSYIGAVIHYGVVATRQYVVDSYTDDAENHIVTMTFTVNEQQYTSQVPYNSLSYSGGYLNITGEYGVVKTNTVASHPGDDAMAEIGNIMINELGLN